MGHNDKVKTSTPKTPIFEMAPNPGTTNHKHKKNGISVIGTSSVALSADTVVTGLRLVIGLIPQPRSYSVFAPPFTRKNMQ